MIVFNTLFPLGHHERVLVNKYETLLVLSFFLIPYLIFVVK